MRFSPITAQSCLLGHRCNCKCGVFLAYASCMARPNVPGCTVALFHESFARQPFVDFCRRSFLLLEKLNESAWTYQIKRGETQGVRLAPVLGLLSPSFITRQSEQRHKRPSSITRFTLFFRSSATAHHARHSDKAHLWHPENCALCSRPSVETRSVVVVCSGASVVVVRHRCRRCV